MSESVSAIVRAIVSARRVDMGQVEAVGPGRVPVNWSLCGAAPWQLARLPQRQQEKVVFADACLGAGAGQGARRFVQRLVAQLKCAPVDAD